MWSHPQAPMTSTARRRDKCEAQIITHQVTGSGRALSCPSDTERDQQRRTSSSARCTDRHLGRARDRSPVLRFIGTGCRAPGGALRLLASFEPHRSENPTSGRFAQKPTSTAAGHSRDSCARPSDATSNPVAPARDSLSGQPVRVTRRAPRRRGPATGPVCQVPRSR
jgi:hypothetical protein